MNRHNRDVVVLNVGGTSFTTSVSTLRNSSSYFRSRLSEHWREDDHSTEDPIFIDQDPKLFSVLISYMRVRSIAASKLTTPVILLARFLGMEELLHEVKATAIRSKFEWENSALFTAAQAADLVKENDTRKKFASLTILDPEDINIGQHRNIHPDFIVSVEVQSDDGTVKKLSNCVTIVDALNLLNELGYTRFELDKMEMHKGIFEIARVWFSKLIVDEDAGDAPHYSESQASIIQEDGSSFPKERRKEFCCNVEYDRCNEISSVEAITGNEKISYTVRNTLIADEGVLDEITTGTYRSKCVVSLDSKLKRHNWLQEMGYTKFEVRLSYMYSKVCEEKVKTKDPVTFSVWSRPFFESRAEIV